jgi:hypothetical protein
MLKNGSISQATSEAAPVQVTSTSEYKDGAIESGQETLQDRGIGDNSVRDKPVENKSEVELWVDNVWNNDQLAHTVDDDRGNVFKAIKKVKKRSRVPGSHQPSCPVWSGEYVCTCPMSDCEMGYCMDLDDEFRNEEEYYPDTEEPVDIEEYADDNKDFRAWLMSYVSMSRSLQALGRDSQIPFGMASAPRLVGTGDAVVTGDKLITIIASTRKLKHHWTASSRTNGDLVYDRRLTSKVVYEGKVDSKLKDSRSWNEKLGSDQYYGNFYITILEGLPCSGTSWNLAAMAACSKLTPSAVYTGSIGGRFKDEVLFEEVAAVTRKRKLARNYGYTLITSSPPEGSKEDYLSAADIYDHSTFSSDLPVVCVSFGQVVAANSRITNFYFKQQAIQSVRKSEEWQNNPNSKLSDEVIARIREHGKAVGREEQAENLIASMKNYASKASGPGRHPRNHISKGLYEGYLAFLQLDGKDFKLDKKTRAVVPVIDDGVRLNSFVMQSYGDGKYVPIDGRTTYFDLINAVDEGTVKLNKVQVEILRKKERELEEGSQTKTGKPRAARPNAMGFFSNVVYPLYAAAAGIGPPQRVGARGKKPVQEQKRIRTTHPPIVAKKYPPPPVRKQEEEWSDNDLEPYDEDADYAKPQSSLQSSMGRTPPASAELSKRGPPPGIPPLGKKVKPEGATLYATFD